MSENKSVKQVSTRRYEDPINIVGLFLFLLNRWYIIIACTVVGAIAMGVVTNTEVIPMYRSQSMLFVTRTGSINSLSDLQVGSSMTQDYIVISRSKPVIDTAIQTLYEQTGVELTREQALAAISVDEMDDTHILQFTVMMNDPEIACDLCNALMDAMADQIAYITNSEKPTIVERAEVEPEAVNMATSNNNRQVLVGAACGLALSVGILGFLFLMDDKIKTAEDIEKYIGVPVLVSIPLDKSQTFKKSTKKSSNKS